MECEIIKVSNLQEANALELTEETVLVVLTPLGDVKKSTYGKLKLNAGGLQLYTKRITILPADVKKLNTNPVPFGIITPAGYAPRAIAFDGSLDFNATAFDTNGNLLLRCVGSTDPQAGFSGLQFLFGTVSRTSTSTLTSGTGATSDQLINGADLEAFVSTGNPLNGDSEITLTVVYFFEQL